MRKLLVLLFLVAARPCVAQTTPRPSVFVALAGDALLGMSVHVEVPVRANLLVRAGVGTDLFSHTTVFPVQVVMLVGAGSLKLELAGGITVANEPTGYSGNWHLNGPQVFPSGFLGYRYERSPGVLFRIGLTPRSGQTIPSRGPPSGSATRSSVPYTGIQIVLALRVPGCRTGRS